MSIRLQLKMVLLGKGGVGKTSLVNRYVHQRFATNYLQTLGEDVFSKKLVLDNNQIMIQIHDLAGQERFSQFRASYIKGADIGLAVFDLTTIPTLTELQDQWLPDLSKTIDKKFYLTIVGNKTDLKERRKIDSTKGKALVDYVKKHYPNITIVEYIETSAKENENVDVAFLNLVTKFVKEQKK